MHVLIVSGDDDFKRKRQVELLIDQARTSRASVIKLPPIEPGMHFPAILSGEVMYHGLGDAKLDLKGLTADPGVSLTLEIPTTVKETTRIGQWAKANPAYHKALNRPPLWELESYCVEFIVGEFKLYKKACPSAFASAMYQKVGSDLSILAREVEKVAYVMGSESMVEAKHFAGLLSGIGEVPLSSLATALSERSKVRLSKAFAELEAQGTPLFLVTRTLLKTVWQWLEVAQAYAKLGKDGASALKLNPWYFENKLLPNATRWGVDGLKRILLACIQAEQAQLAGQYNPWSLLVTALLQAV